MRKYFENVENKVWHDFSWRSYFFAEVSALAYHDGTKFKKYISKLDFKKYKFLENDGAQCHIFSDGENTVIAFRGTEPKEMSDIRADLLAVKRKSKTEGRVHLGFKLEIKKLWPDIEALINKDKRKLWITGHSLGGAMATICASRLEDKMPSLYTYGSPRVGGKEFCQGLNVEHIRVVNNNDIVSSVPPWFFGYRHHGSLHYINFYGNIRRMTKWQRVKDQLRGRWRALKKGQLFDGVFDHNIGLYADKLKKQWQ